jgi:hypothetical protein
MVMIGKGVAVLDDVAEHIVSPLAWFGRSAGSGDRLRGEYRLEHWRISLPTI